MAVFKAACKEYGESEVRYEKDIQKGGGLNFPVLSRDGRIVPLFQNQILLRECLWWQLITFI